MIPYPAPLVPGIYGGKLLRIVRCRTALGARVAAWWLRFRDWDCVEIRRSQDTKDYIVSGWYW